MARWNNHEHSGSGKAKKAKNKQIPAFHNSKSLSHHRFLHKSASTTSAELQDNNTKSGKSFKINGLTQGVTVSQKRKQIKFVYPKSQENSFQQVEYVLSQNSNHKTIDGQRKNTENSSHIEKEDVTSKIKLRKKESLNDILFPNRLKHDEKKNSQPHISSTPMVQHNDTMTIPYTKPTMNQDTHEKVSAKEGPRDDRSKRIRSNSMDRALLLSKAKTLSGFSVDDAVKDRAGCRPRANSTDGELNLPQRGLCDERMVLAAHQWGSSWKPADPKGFINLGNTCFLNATLQCLVYLPTVCQSLATMTLPITGNSSSSQKFASILRNLIRQVHGLETSNQSDKSSSTIAPRHMVNAIPSLGQIGSKKGYKFRPGRQEDAHEFLIHLIDAMQDGELKAAGVDPTARGWRDSLPIPRLDETTFIHRVFGGYLRSQVRCTKCSYRSNTYDPFLDLSLEVSKNSCSSILTAFSEFSRKERLDEQNQWRCSGCKKHVCATKQLTVFRPPLSLCIQLKRFTYGVGSYGGFHKKMSHMSGGGGGKINKSIEFPAKLALPLSDGRKCEYNLTGIIVHVGGSSSSGHYTAYVKKPLSQSSQWYHMDDSFVEAVSEKTVLQQRDAYILFYCRTEVKLELPTPPPRSNMTAEQATAHGQARARARADSIAQESDDETLLPTQANVKAIVTTVIKTNGLVGSIKEEQQQVSIPPGANVPLLNGDPSSPSSSEGSESFSDEDAKRKDSKTRIHKDVKSQTTVGVSASPVAILSGVKAPHSIAGEGGKKEAIRPVAIRPESPRLSESSTNSSEGESSSSSSSTSECESSDDDSNLEFMKNAGVVSVFTDDSSSEELPSGTVSKLIPDSTKTEHIKETKLSSFPDGRINSNHGEPHQPKASRKSEGNTKIVLDRGTTHGKLEVMMGPRFKTKNAWKPKATIGGNKGEERDLLGTVQVGKWDDGTDDVSSAQVDRRKIVKKLDKMETSRKRSMHLDRWDAILDQGKQKKVKVKQPETTSQLAVEPKLNPFSRIQSSIQKFNKGRAKGLFRSEQHGSERHSNSSKAGKHGRSGTPKRQQSNNRRYK